MSTQVVLSGPFGTTTTPVDGTDDGTILFLNIPDFVLSAAGTVSVTVQAIDDTGTRTIGPVSFNVVAQVVQQNPLLAIPENVFAQATSASGANVTFFVGGTSFVDPPPAPTSCAITIRAISTRLA